VRRALLTSAIGAVILGGAVAAASDLGRGAQDAIVSVYPAQNPRGVMATSGGWAYCLQVQKLARRSSLTLVCGQYSRDGYTGYGLRSKRLLDWGDPGYLATLAGRIAAVHKSVGGELILLGVSYSGFGVATLASHHPELRPDRLIVVDSYLDLVARRAVAGSGGTGAEIDAATGGAPEALRAQSVSVAGLAQLVRTGTKVTVVWSTSPDEAREFQGATCNQGASAGVLAQLATAVGRPVAAWVTEARHGHDLWDNGPSLLAGDPPGRKVLFTPAGGVPPGSTCG